MVRFDHVGVVVDDLDAAIAFFVGLGFKDEGRWTVDGDIVSRINGLDNVQAEVAMVAAPDGTGKLELVKYLTPVDNTGVQLQPANTLGYRHICLEIQDLKGTVDRLRSDGFDTVGEVQAYGDTYRLVYVRGPEGLIVELAETISPDAASPV